MKYLLIMPLFLTNFILSGCTDGPREKYVQLCSDVASTAKQRQACNCLGYEYGKALTTVEYRTVNTMLERSIQELRKDDKDNGDPVIVGKKDIDESVYMKAMKKIALLQRSGICGIHGSERGG